MRAVYAYLEGGELNYVMLLALEAEDEEKERHARSESVIEDDDIWNW